MLSNQLDRPVLDQTGLTGKYDFTLDYSVNGFAAPVDSTSETEPDLAAAVQKQLGLRLVAGKAKLDVLIIDQIRKEPISN